MKVIDFNSIPSLLRQFHDERTCKIYLANLRFKDGLYCPHCGDTTKIYRFKDQITFKCSSCKMRFNARTRTIFENTKLPLQKWFLAIYLLSSHKKGISSQQAAKDLNVTQKTAWFMLHRLRYAITNDTWDVISPDATIIELDETFVGGRVPNMRLSKRKAIKNKTSPLIKTAVFGIMERKGIVQAKVIPQVRRSVVLPIVQDTLQKDNIIYTDSSHLYTPLKSTHVHESINHEGNEYVRGAVHTNTIEGFWSLLKRGIIGVYHYTSPQHLDKYLGEFTFRYNSRKQSDFDRFNLLLSKTIGRLLRYNFLINKY